MLYRFLITFVAVALLQLVAQAQAVADEKKTAGRRNTSRPQVVVV